LILKSIITRKIKKRKYCKILFKNYSSFVIYHKSGIKNALKMRSRRGFEDYFSMENF